MRLSRILLLLCLVSFGLNFSAPVQAQLRNPVVSIQPKADNNAGQEDNRSTTANRTGLTAKENLVRDAQNGIDRSLGVLTVAGAVMAVSVGLMGVVVMALFMFLILEHRRRESAPAKDHRPEAKPDEKVERDVRLLQELRRRIEGEVIELRKDLEKSPLPSLTKRPSEEIREKFNFFGQKLDMLEMLGLSLIPADYFNRALDLCFKARYEPAVAAFDRALALKSDNIPAWIYRSAMLIKLERYEEAMKGYEKALIFEPNNIHLWFDKVVILEKLGKHDDALTTYDRIIDLKPDNVQAWFDKAQLLERIDRLEDALRYYGKATELKPDHAQFWFSRGAVLRKIGRYDEALKSYGRAFELKPDNLIALYECAGIYSLKGDKYNALENLAGVIKNDPKYKELAQKNDDFKNFWDDPDFRKIIA